MATGGNMDFPGQYQAEILNAVQSIDLDKVAQVIQVFKAARAHGQKIFVCGAGGTDAMAAQFLCDMVKSAGVNRAFRILALSDRSPIIGNAQAELVNNRVFVEQLKNFAEPEDVVMGISTSGNTPSIVNAIEYACWIGCRTIGITGGEGGELARLAELSIEVPVSHAGSIEDVHMIICHMIGYYFVEFEKTAKYGV
jgi:D-sedoheptulose 7-phosphate isomerase